VNHQHQGALILAAIRKKKGPHFESHEMRDARPLSGLFNIGSSSKLMPTLSEKFPPPHGVDSPVVTNLLQLCGVTIVLALLLTIYGLLRSKTSANDADG
jgi:hypothetical protein